MRSIDLVTARDLRDDEVVLANDSCFLVRPLDDVFAEMDRRACDWWSLQATSMEFNEDDVGEDVSMPLDVVRRRTLLPSAFIRKTCELPSRVSVTASVFPSGDQAGALFEPRKLATARRSPVATVCT